MPKMILQPRDFKQIIRRRRLTGADRHDEVWDGVYVMSPAADNEHQTLGFKLASAFDQALGRDGRITVQNGANVSDRAEGWTKNYRCPDALVFLPGCPARDCGTHWLGGPDFAVEVLSHRDRARKKFAFYAKVGVRELLLADRDPWCLELYRLHGGQYALIGKSTPDQPAVLASTVLPLTFRLLPAEPRPRIEVARTDGSQHWTM